VAGARGADAPLSASQARALPLGRPTARYFFSVWTAALEQAVRSIRPRGPWSRRASRAPRCRRQVDERAPERRDARARARPWGPAHRPGPRRGGDEPERIVDAILQEFPRIRRRIQAARRFGRWCYRRPTPRDPGSRQVGSVRPGSEPRGQIVLIFHESPEILEENSRPPSSLSGRLALDAAKAATENLQKSDHWLPAYAPRARPSGRGAAGACHPNDMCAGGPTLIEPSS
jgi:hypothetical protein